ncbi:Fcf2 pre-rRNA processing [Babesia duncani]|uniref:Fcf2 pre-rRNA processing n=1 Tax=Babesia duncani TaxID=323732 RepID=A0AAD9PNU6_9APIC|nr:Fcf2 pre-rRNA processing [Babesia duncani]
MGESETNDSLLLKYAGIHSSAIRDLYLNDKETLPESPEFALDLHEDIGDAVHVTVKPPPANTRLKRSKLERIRKLSWNPLVEREATPEMKRQWLALQLRGFVDPKKFYKRSLTRKIEQMPSKFDVGVMHQGSKLCAGAGNESQASGTVKSRRSKGKSILSQMLSSDLEWTRKRYREIQAAHTSGSKGWYARVAKRARH